MEEYTLSIYSFFSTYVMINITAIFLATLGLSVGCILVIGATLIDVRSYVRGYQIFEGSNLSLYIAGFLAALISGYIVIGWLIKLIVRAKLRYFAYYCWCTALIFIILFLTGVITSTIDCNYKILCRDDLYQLYQ
jgi:undecaprenyl-diphosphatase